MASRGNKRRKRPTTKGRADRVLRRWDPDREPSAVRDKKENSKVRQTRRRQAKPSHSCSDRILFDERWLAKRLGCSVSLIRKLRYSGDGPKVTHVGRLVRYHINDIRKYERSLRRKR